MFVSLILVVVVDVVVPGFVCLMLMMMTWIRFFSDSEGKKGVPTDSSIFFGCLFVLWYLPA